MSKKNITKQRSKPPKTYTTKTSYVFGVKHRSLLVRLGRVVSRVLPQSRWPQFAKPFQKTHPAVHPSSDSPEKVMHTISKTTQNTTRSNRRTYHKRSLKTLSKTAPSTRVNATTTFDTLIKICLTLGLLNIVRQFDLLPVYTYNKTASLSKTTAPAHLQLDEYCKNEKINAKDQPLYAKLYDNCISCCQSNKKINWIFTNNKESKWHYKLAAYLQKYHSKLPNVKYYVCTPSNTKQKGAYNDTNIKKTNGFLQYMYGVQCRYPNTSAENPIEVSYAVKLIKKGLDYLINTYCHDTQNNTYFIFHPGKTDDSGYYFACNDHLKDDDTTQNAKNKTPKKKDNLETLLKDVFFDHILKQNGNIVFHTFS